MKQFLKGLKNLPGWRTREKLVIFSVDDYGNVRVDSAQARQRMIEAGLKLDNQFDRSDALETREDLEALFETLSSVRDVQGLPACFTPYSVCANPDFVRMRDDHSAYKYEPLIQTFKRLASSQPAAYEGAWALWQEGMAEGLLRPQYHGREHLNLEFIERKLAARDPILMTALANDSLTGLEPEPSLPSVGFTAGFAVHDGNESELEQHREILADGLRLFEETFGFASKTFTPPAMQINPRLYPELESLGVRAIDKAQRCVRRLDAKTTVREWNFLGPARGQHHINLVRNVVFEPGKGMVADPVGYALGQVEAAFRWRKPAIISSHRVNFCGHIDPNNRQQGIAALGELLKGIVKRWPDVRFISADQLVERIEVGA